MKAPVFDPTWPEDVVALYRHDMQEIWDASIAPHIWHQYQNQLAIYLALVDPAKKLDILDVGCAQATLAILLAESGHKVLAVDIRQQFLDYAKSRYSHGEIEFLCANVLDVDLPGQYDLIFCNQLVEHVVYPQQLVERLAQLLKPGGRLVMSTPNGEYIKSHLPSFTELGDPDQWQHKQFTADSDGHFFAYLDSELQQVFANSQLKNIEVRFFESPWVSGHMKFRYLHSLLSLSILRSLDRLLLAMPKIGKSFAHQMMVIGQRDGFSPYDQTSQNQHDVHGAESKKKAKSLA